RVGGVDPVDIGVDVADIGAKRDGHRNGAGVRSTAAQGRNAIAFQLEPLKAGDDGHLTLLQTLPDTVSADLLDAGCPVGAVSKDRDLPSLPGPSGDTH